MSRKTIKQVADEFGVSKTSIRNLMDDDFRANYTEAAENGVIYITEAGVAKIRESGAFKDKEKALVEKAKTTNSDEIVGLKVRLMQAETENRTMRESYEARISLLEQLLTGKENQIEDLRKQVQSLNDQIERRDQIQLAERQYLLEAESRSSFWSRIFGSKKSSAASDGK